MQLPSSTSRAALVTMGVILLGTVSAQYSIDWSTVDGGGGRSSGGVFAVHGTIGQPDAHPTPMTGGEFSLVGGFWPAVTIQVAGAPTLRIRKTGPAQVTLSWTPDPGGWVLQESPGLSPSHWTDSASGSTNPVSVPIVTPTRFYRLNKP